jgi:hypothetical protein
MIIKFSKTYQISFCLLLEKGITPAFAVSLNHFLDFKGGFPVKAEAWVLFFWAGRPFIEFEFLRGGVENG